MKKFLKPIHRVLKGYLKNQWEPIPAILDSHDRVIGHSHEGRPILAYRINTGPKKVLFTSVLHGNEVGTQRLNHHLYHWVLEYAEEFKEFSFWFVPCLNPDGFAHALRHPDYLKGGRKGRFNGRDVDLNRNFPVKSFKKDSHWNHGANYKELTPVFCGEEGGSENETKALTDFILGEGIAVLFMFHNVGEDVMPSNDPLAQKLADLFVAETGFATMTHQDWLKLGQTGTCKEWCEENHVSFVEVEGSVASTRYGSDWNRQKPGLEACLRELKAS